MTDILKDLARLGRMHKSIAEPFGGGSLGCAKCGNGHPITVDDTARYFARGWPKCCEQTMVWTPAKRPA